MSAPVRITMTARYPDGEEHVFPIVVKNALHASFVEQVLERGLADLGFKGALQITVDGVTSGRPVGAPRPVGRPRPQPPRLRWWQRLVSGG